MSERLEKPPALQRIRARHRHTARLLASGYTIRDVAEEMGYTPERVSQLANDPAFAELVAFYEADPEIKDRRVESLDLLKRIETQNTLRAAVLRSEVLDEIEASDEPLVHSAKIIKIYEGGADRIGFGKHQINHNVSDFATQLERAIAASGRAKLIEGEVVSQPPTASHGLPSPRPVAHGESPHLAQEGDRATPLLSPSPIHAGAGQEREANDNPVARPPALRRRF